VVNGPNPDKHKSHKRHSLIHTLSYTPGSSRRRVVKKTQRSRHHLGTPKPHWSRFAPPGAAVLALFHLPVCVYVYVSGMCVCARVRAYVCVYVYVHTHTHRMYIHTHRMKHVEKFHLPVCVCARTHTLHHTHRKQPRSRQVYAPRASILLLL
jgi:hypothetical protein